MPKRRSPIERVTVETATLRAHVRQVVSSVDSLGQRLRDAGSGVADRVAPVPGAAGSEELRLAAGAIRSGAAYALALTGDLLSHAGRLEQIAATYDASIQNETEV